jgi:undecaprenyl diphosphate synthase
MDGNRRWAREDNLSSFEGHKKGAHAFMQTVGWVKERGIPHAVFYAFSTENWNRASSEIDYLTKLGIKHFKTLIQKLLTGTDIHDPEVGVRYKFIGDMRFDEKLLQQLHEVEEKTKDFSGTTAWIALSYGGRAEIVDAVNKAIKKGEEVSENSFRSFMWSNEMPDPDLIVRTGGQQRLSNFLTWQSAYSELVFLEKYWPDLTSEDLDTIIKEYGERNRTFGA